ncbi:MAG: hypothetical protein ABIW83_06270, partial [Allosphingosinicella sp.]
MGGLGRMVGWLAAAGAAALLAGCSGKPAPAPAAPRPVHEPLRPPVSAPSEPGVQDSPDPALTPGDWLYAVDSSGSAARFGAAGGESFSLRCGAARGRISLARSGPRAALRVRTSFGERALPAGAELAATDPLFDEIAFSRGRFTVEAEGLPALIL